MASITLRSLKGSPLTITEMDNNFSNINTELGSKLNTSAYTASDILTKLKTVDGATSGLDADLVNGLNPDITATANTLAARDGSARLTATTFVGNLTGNVTGDVTGNVSGTASNVTDTVAIAKGGTGATNVTTARTNLGLGSLAVKNTVATTDIDSLAVTEAKISSGAITETKLANNSVTAVKIAQAAVGTSEIASQAVTSSEIATGAVTEAKLASNSVTASKIAAGAVGASEIATGAVGSSELASGSVTNAKVASGIDAAKLTGTLPALNGSNLTGIEPPTDRNAVGTYRLYMQQSTGTQTSVLGSVGSTFSNSYGFSGTWRVMDVVTTGTVSGIVSTYNILTLVVRVS